MESLAGLDKIYESLDDLITWREFEMLHDLRFYPYKIQQPFNIQTNINMFRIVPYTLMTFMTFMMTGASALGDYGKHKAVFKFTDEVQGDLNCQTLFDDVSQVKQVVKSVYVTGNTSKYELQLNNPDYHELKQTVGGDFIMSRSLCFDYNNVFFNASEPVFNEWTSGVVTYTVETRFEEYEDNLDSRVDNMLSGLVSRICAEEVNCGEKQFVSSWYGLTNAEIAIIVILSALGVFVIGSAVYAHCKRGDCAVPQTAAPTLPPPTNAPVAVPTDTAVNDVV